MVAKDNLILLTSSTMRKMSQKISMLLAHPGPPIKSTMILKPGIISSFLNAIRKTMFCERF